MFKRTFSKYIQICAVTIIIISSGGCAVTGPAFEQIESIPSGKALIYIYRPATFRGAALTPYVVVNESNAMPLRPGGYYPYFSDPGIAEISITHTGKRSITAKLEVGETYYVRGGTVPMGMGVPSIKLMSQEAGMAEVMQCKRQPDVHNQEIKGPE